MKRRAADFGVALAVLAADQVVKAIVLRAGESAFPIPVVPGLFRLTFVRNRGGVFGLLHTAPEPWHTLALVAVPLAAVLVLSVLIWRAAPADRWTRCGLALILGGAVGNQIDRLARGWVLDYLDVYVEGNALAGWLRATFGTSHWPNFNVADSAICIGAGALILDAFFHLRRERREKAHAGS